MDRITQEAYYRQRVLKYAAKHGVSASNIGYTKARERSQGKGGDLRSKYNLTLTALSGLCVTYV